MSRRIRVYITKGSKTSTVKFPYDEEILDLVRSYTGRQWDPDNRVWIIYNHDVPKLEAALKKMGHSVHYVTAQDARSEERRERGRQHQQRQRGQNWWEDDDAFSHHSQYNRTYQEARDRQQSGPRAGRPTTSAEQEREWAVALFRKVGKGRAKNVYRALAKVLHTDTGEGANDLIQQLNDAYEPWKKMENNG